MEDAGEGEESEKSVAVGCLCGTDLTDPCECVVGFRTTEGANMCFTAVGMGASGVGSTEVKGDADLFPIRVADGAIGSLSPGRFSVSEFRWCAAVAVMFTEGVVQLTAEDAASWVMRLAAMRKWLV